EQVEERLVVEAAQGRDLELHERVLNGIDVNRVDLARSRKEVVERVAAGAGDDSHAVVRAEVECLAVECRVFPAGVVDQVPAVYRLEDARTEPLAGGRGVDHAKTFRVRPAFADR